MGIELLVVSSQHPGSVRMMEDHLAVCLVSTTDREGLEAADMILGHYGAAHRHHRLVLYVVKTAIVSSCDQMRKVSVLVEAGVASQRCECQQRCVVVGSGCTEEMPCFQGCCLRFQPELEWRVGEAAAVVVADVQLAV
jgi:hypothetical protein